MTPSHLLTRTTKNGCVSSTSSDLRTQPRRQPQLQRRNSTGHGLDAVIRTRLEARLWKDFCLVSPLSFQSLGFVKGIDLTRQPSASRRSHSNLSLSFQSLFSGCPSVRRGPSPYPNPMRHALSLSKWFDPLPTRPASALIPNSIVSTTQKQAIQMGGGRRCRYCHNFDLAVVDKWGSETKNSRFNLSYALRMSAGSHARPNWASLGRLSGRFGLGWSFAVEKLLWATRTGVSRCWL